MCVLCGRSCAGQARIKNARGQYAHKACVEAKRRARDEPAPEEYNDALGGGIEDVLGDLAAYEESAPAVAAADSVGACPGCGIRMAPGAVICMGCGYNAQLGKLMSTKRMEAGEGMGGKLGGGAAAVGGVAAAPVLPLIGALIGGAIGAGIWAAIAYFTGYEVGFIAILVGAMCGLGATLGGGAETTGGGMIAGVMAAVIAVASIGAGKYMALSMTYKQQISGLGVDLTPMVVEDVEDDWILSKIAYEHCERRIDAGEQIQWGNPALYLESAQWPDDFPKEIQDMTVDHWDAMSEREHMAYRSGVADEYGMDSFRDVDERWALGEMAASVAESKIADGETIDWPNPHLPNEAAVWPDDYPADVREHVHNAWDSMDEQTRSAHKQEIADSINSVRDSISGGALARDITFAATLGSFKSPIQLLFVVLAIGAAYRIGSNDD